MVIFGRFDVLVVRSSAASDSIGIEVARVLEGLGLTWTSVWGDWESISDYLLGEHPVQLVVFCGTNKETAELARQVRAQNPAMPIFIVGGEKQNILKVVGVDALVQFFTLPDVARTFGYRPFVELEPAIVSLGINR